MEDLTDLTFIIPVKIENKERLQNLWAVLYYINHNFNTNIIVAEQDDNKSEPVCEEYTNTCFLRVDINLDLCYKTKLLNIMLEKVKTKYVVSYDCDVVFSVSQYIEAINKLRNNECDFVYPYDQPTADIKRNFINDFLKNNGPHGMPKDSTFVYVPHAIAKGGAVFANTYAYRQIGGENENFIAYGPEDVERHYRLITLGYNFTRVSGEIYHMYHKRSLSSSFSHKYYKSNYNELEEIMRLTKSEIKQKINEWVWYEKLNR